MCKEIQVVTGAGLNGRGNEWLSLNHGKGYCYYNANGSYYYRNPYNGSYYYNSGNGYAPYTAPNGHVEVMTGEESNPMKSAYSYYSEAEDIKARMRVAYKEFLS